MVLNAELKSTKSAHAYASGCSRCLRTRCTSADGIICTTFILVHELEWIKYIFNVIIQFSHRKLFKTLHDNWGDSHWSVIIYYLGHSSLGTGFIWGIFHRSGTVCVSTDNWKQKHKFIEFIKLSTKCAWHVQMQSAQRDRQTDRQRRTDIETERH